MTSPHSDETTNEKSFDLFEALNAADTKQYDFLNQFTPEEQKKFVPFMFVQWMASINSPKKPHLAEYAVIATNHYANKYLFDDQLKDHPELTWQLMCASGTGTSQKYNHKWLPQLSKKFIHLDEKITLKEATEYSKKVPDFTDNVSEYVKQQNAQYDLATMFPTMKLSDIQALSKILSDDTLNDLKEMYGISEPTIETKARKATKGAKKSKG